jgi:adenylate cyclase
LVHPNGGTVDSAIDVTAERLEIGRQRDGEPAPFAQHQQSGSTRLIIARLQDEASVSRRHAVVVAKAPGRVQIENVSASLPIGLSNGHDLAPGASCEISLPALLTLGNKAIRVQEALTGADGLQSLEEATLPPGRARLADADLSTLTTAVGAVEMKHLLRWLRTAMDVLQSAAGAEDFFARAARALIDVVGLDSSRVLLLTNGSWREVASQSAFARAAHSPQEPSRRVLDKVRQEKRTYWQSPAAAPDLSSMLEMRAVVAAPILDCNGAVLGVLYGDRGHHNVAINQPLSELEATLTELLAGGVAAGLARLESERSATAIRVQFEQFFTPQLARQLMEKPDLLSGRLTEVSILFCDIRNYSRISRSLGPPETLAWVRNVLGLISEAVLAEEGVLVDYVGDAVMAMWGAPQPQSNHACRAGRAALAMLAAVPRLNERWQSVLGESMQLGIGINSGEALVGNIGSRQKFKYGALGNAVNLASRLQGLTKFLRTDLLVTEATRRQLGDGFSGRRVCSVRVMNISDPVTLYQLVDPDSGGAEWASLYEQALADFENRQFGPAARKLANFLSDRPGDGPSLVLLSRAVNFLVEEPASFDPVWEPPGK